MMKICDLCCCIHKVCFINDVIAVKDSPWLFVYAIAFK